MTGTGTDARQGWAVTCGSCRTGSGGFGPFAAEEARTLAEVHDALLHARHPTAAAYTSDHTCPDSDHDQDEHDHSDQHDDGNQHDDSDRDDDSDDGDGWF